MPTTTLTAPAVDLPEGWYIVEVYRDADAAGQYEGFSADQAIYGPLDEEDAQLWLDAYPDGDDDLLDLLSVDSSELAGLLGSIDPSATARPVFVNAVGSTAGDGIWVSLPAAD